MYSKNIMLKYTDDPFYSYLIVENVIDFQNLI